MSAELVPALIAGVLLLAYGRRLYWLLVGVVGFVAGFYLALQALSAGGRVLALVAGVLVGLLAALLAVWFQKLLLILAGLAVGGYACYWLALQAGLGPGPGLWILVALAAAAGAVLVPMLFQAALVVLSSVAGATLVVQALGLEAVGGSVTLVLLAAGGILFQLVFARRWRKKPGGEE